MVTTRFAPSPTGFLHIGGVRTALFSWLYAKNQQGKFVLRIEDTDLERSSQEAVAVILQGLEWLGLAHDGQVYYQTQRFDHYKKIIQELLDKDLAYYCYMSKEELDQLRAEQEARKETPRYDGRYRDYKGSAIEGIAPVIRFKMPLEGKTIIPDLVQGKVVYNNSELDDFIIARSDGTPTYNFCVVVDDHDMGITHVVRGDDHLNNTPKQVNVFKALDWKPPQYAHLPLILDEEGKKLSKRNNAANILLYREQGYLPQAVLNYLVRLGWSYGDQEVFTVEEMIQLFSLEKINKSAARINPEKLAWLNQQYIKSLPKEEVAKHLQWQLNNLKIDYSNGPSLELVIEILGEKSKTLLEIAQASRPYFENIQGYDEKAEKELVADAMVVFENILSALEAISDWTPEILDNTVKTIMKDLNVKMPKVAKPLRAALLGTTMSPSIDMTLFLMGREKTLVRIKEAMVYIKNK